MQRILRVLQRSATLAALEQPSGRGLAQPGGPDRIHGFTPLANLRSRAASGGQWRSSLDDHTPTNILNVNRRPMDFPATSAPGLCLSKIIPKSHQVRGSVAMMPFAHEKGITFSNGSVRNMGYIQLVIGNSTRTGGSERLVHQSH